MSRNSLLKHAFSLRGAVTFFTLLTVLFIYNSCQGYAIPGIANAFASAICKVTLEDGKVRELRFDPAVPPAPFADFKVRLKPAAKRDRAIQAKSSAVTGEVTVNSGTSLAVLINNECLHDPINLNSLDLTIITKASIQSEVTMPQLKRQVYLWQLDRSYTDTELESLAAQEPCLIGVARNNTYKPQSMFNDPSYIYQKQMLALSAEAAMARFYDVKGAMARTTGAPVILAALDTGTDWNHPDLFNNVWTSLEGHGIDITTLGTGSVNFDPADQSPDGHGTHVSGIMAAVSNNGIGIVGTMPYRAQVMAIKIFKKNSAGEQSTSSQFIYNGIQFAYLNGASVLNMSISSSELADANDPLVESGLSEGIDHGMISVVAIGNSPTGNPQLLDGTTIVAMPGQFSTHEGVIGVGSIDSNTGQVSSFSNYSTVFGEIAAPGAIDETTGIYSTLPTALGSYGQLSGTSQAAPMISAAAGLTIGLIREAYGLAPSPKEVERILLASAVKSAQLQPYFKNGNRLDLLSLVAKINTDWPLTGSGTPVHLPTECQGR